MLLTSDEPRAKTGHNVVLIQNRTHFGFDPKQSKFLCLIIIHHRFSAPEVIDNSIISRNLLYFGCKQKIVRLGCVPIKIYEESPFTSAIEKKWLDVTDRWHCVFSVVSLGLRGRFCQFSFGNYYVVEGICIAWRLGHLLAACVSYATSRTQSMLHDGVCDRRTK